ncbi:MAG: DUF2490 domain-containing protein [Bacteroidales bacterium]|nr:DUF2490 domain-containing protein [Bacteroidales bacterium]
MHTIILIFVIMALLPQTMRCSDNGTDGWEYVNVTYNFKSLPKWSIGGYFEHHNNQYQHFESCFSRFSVGFSPIFWLKTTMSYDLLRSNHNWTNRLVPEATGTFSIGDVKIALRERFLYTWCPAKSQQSHELRSRIKAQYHILKTRFSPYLASELFTTDAKWTKIRYYVGTNYQINKQLNIEWYYLYHVFRKSDSKHILGLGLNINI